MGPPLSGQGTALKPPKEALLETLAAYSPRSWPSCRSRRREAPFPAPPPGRLILFFQETEAQRTLRLCLRSRGVSVRLEAECRRRSTSVDPPSSGRWMLRSGCWWLSVW